MSKHTYTIIKYIRLSIDDGITESLSIPNQRLILNGYIDGLDISNAEVLEMVDNGYSGTNMERPAVQELLELVRAGKVDLIITKDFSRFSRSSLESGYYIEQVFPLYGVRFISVSDRFDSNDYKNDTGGIDVAFKFLMHEYYSQDLSKKVKSSKRIKMRRGEHIVANAIYGYYKADSEKWEPDEPAADVVRQIFQMARTGFPTAKIRDRLYALQYPTPREYIEMKRGKDIKPKYRWTTRMVLHMLENEQYAGSYVSGKQESKAVGSHSKINTDKSTWIVIPDHHTPIVSKEIFTEVQDTLQKQIKSSINEKPLTSWKDNVIQPKRQRMLNGELKKTNVIYGYQKNKNGELEIDIEAATVIVKIFEMAVLGYTASEISKTLFENHYPTPKEHIQSKRGKSNKPSCRWTISPVHVILKNQQYTGAYVSGKILKDYETGKKYHTPKSEWVIIPDKHPPIVSKEVFEKVQEILERNKRGKATRNAPVYLLQGNIVKCGCCGYSLAYNKSSRPEKSVYRCQHTYSDVNALCHKMAVKAEELHTAVMESIKKQAELLLMTNDLSDLRKTDNHTIQVTQYKEQHKQLIAERQKQYEQFVVGEISKDEYAREKAELADQIEELNRQITMLTQKEQNKQATHKAADLAKTIVSQTVTDREVVEMLVDKVHVSPNNHIEITWKIADFAGGV